MLESVELKKRENSDDLDFLQMNGYVPCGIISIWVYFFLPETSACVWNTEVKHVPDSPKRNVPQALVSGKKKIPRYYKIR